jgi:hypothetical protein
MPGSSPGMSDLSGVMSRIHVSNTQHHHCESLQSTNHVIASEARAQRRLCAVPTVANNGGHASGRAFAQPLPLPTLRQIRVFGLAARSARALLEIFRPFQTEGVGNAGCPMHPQPRMRILVVNMHASIHSEPPESPGIPARNGLRLMSRSPRRDQLSCHRRPVDRRPVRPVELNQPPRDLTPAFEASGPHVFTVRVSIVRLACQVITHEERSALQSLCTRDTGRVHRIPPRVRDVASHPCRWDETAGDMQLIWVGTEAVSFFLA